MNNKHLQLLRDIYEHFDGIADGAPDASYAAKQALRFSEPLKKLIDSAQSRDAAAYHCNTALDMIYEDVPRAQVNALISIALCLMENG
jgi:hypothetical protein